LSFVPKLLVEYPVMIPMAIREHILLMRTKIDFKTR
jgi:hypothetical protein